MNSKPKTGVTSALEKNAGFVIYKLPGEAKSRWMGEYNPQVSKIETLPQIDGFLFYPFCAKQTAPVFLTADQYGIYPSNDFDSFIGSCSTVNKQFQNTEISIKKQTYIRNLEKAAAKMKSAGVQKFIFSRIETVPALKTELIETLLEKLQNKYPQAMVYLFNHPATGLWMGATPEVFLSKKRDKIITHSLAGTQASKIKHEYIWGQKEIEEQQYVTQFIEDLIQDHKLKYNKTGPFTVEAGPVAHLKTTFEIDAGGDFDYWKFISKLHPTPAVCGLPKNNAREFIIETETHDRAYYTGFFGPVTKNGDFDFFVNLRCMNVGAENMNLFTGGGITEKSIAESEWTETQIKVSTLTSIIEELRTEFG